MTTHVEIELTCPACGTGFESTSWMSTNVFDKRTDFQPLTVGFSPLPLYVHTCTGCGFSGGGENFQPGTQVSVELAGRIRAELGPLAKEGRSDAATRYEFKARIAEWRGDSSEKIADAYLYAAWCCVDIGSPEREAEYRRLAIEYFEKALNTQGLIPENGVLDVTYLIGELYRRVGDVDIARAWFDKVIDQGGSREDAQDIVSLAQQQRDNPRDVIGEE